MVRGIEISHLKRKSILSARWPQLGPGLIMGTFHRSARTSIELLRSDPSETKLSITHLQALLDLSISLNNGVNLY